MSFLAQISFRIFGHTFTLTSPRCAFAAGGSGCGTVQSRRRLRAESGPPELPGDRAVAGSRVASRVRVAAAASLL